MGKFVKGQCGNPAGRPKGSRNVTTAGLQQKLHDFIVDNWPAFERAVLSLEPGPMAQTFERLLKYRLPTMKEAALTMDLKNLSDADLDSIVNRLIQQYEN